MKASTLREIIAVTGLALVWIGLEGALNGLGWAVCGALLMAGSVWSHLRPEPAPPQKALLVGEQPDGTPVFRPWPPQRGDRPPGNRILEDSQAAGTSPVA